MAADLVLWGVGTSRTLRAHWMLAELGHEYHSHPIGSRTGETLTPEFLRLNHRHKIPVLQHGSIVVTESAAILEYLGETFATPADFHAPNDPESRARLHEWSYFVLSELDAGSLYVVRRHLGLREIYGDAPQAVESARKYFSDNLEAMAPRIAAGGRYLLGDRFSAADILLTSCLEWARIERIPMSDVVEQYRQRAVSRPAYPVALERNFPTAARAAT